MITKKARIIICRHAESLEDIDNSIYDTIKDLDIPLTEKGRLQAKELGIKLQNLLKGATNVKFFTSPGLRNKQTLDIALPYLHQVDYAVTIEPLLVKQDWGYITSENRPGIEEARYKTGVLRYTFPTGESASNLIARLEKFKEKIFHIQKEEKCDIVLLSHGFEFRVLLMLILDWTEEYFESLANLKNAEFRILTQEFETTYSLNKPLTSHGLPITRLM